eukprot:TRINITY_DN3036_c0_g1_i2.p1 TRINITY_DN3036_c0_g1~~TRINITY_DN3036_c0_g1_i2.p1  ORF type:complete len:139 (+),score=21.29 TRINITY_DN3036_c0_g1_i2:315-731(+)
MAFLSDTQKVGIILTCFGIVFTFLGILMLGDRGFLAIGNLSFLAGVTLGIGINKTKKFFFQKEKLLSTTCFLGGILLVLWGWVVIGLIIEFFGVFNLFGAFFPYILGVLREVPYLRKILSLPGIKQAVDRATEGNLPM